MEDCLKIELVNPVYIRVHCHSGVASELSEYFTFKVPGYKFTPAYKNKLWDGSIRLFSTRSNQIYAGLRSHVEAFAKERGYEVELLSDFSDVEFPDDEAADFIKALNTPIAPRDYQVAAFTHAIRKKRAVLVSPTGSGKSFIQYMITMYYQAILAGIKKTLIVVPTTGLVRQMKSDFESYGLPEQHIHVIYSGEDKQTNRPIVISTWQSIFNMPDKWFDQFGVVLMDECHLAKATSTVGILTKLRKCEYRYGFTGSLDGSQTNELVIQGLLGPVKRVATTAELIEQKHLADFQIKAIVLKYDAQIKAEMRQQYKKMTYQDEVSFLISSEQRNRFIKNLALSLKGNTLLLFQLVDRHGSILYNMIKDAAPTRPVFFVHGGVDGEERESIRQLLEIQKDAIVVASAGTFSTGINIRNLHNIIFASPSKSRVRNLQSIGRGLRRSDTKSSATLYDIADDLSFNGRKNHTLRHFIERVSLYNEEKFPYKLFTIDVSK